MRGCFLILEDASADEFADDGVAGDVRCIQGRQAPDHVHEDRQTVLGDERVVEIRGELRDLPQVSAEGEAASGEAGQSRGVVRALRRSQLPAVRAVWSFKRGVTERGKIAPVGSQFEKSPPFQGKRRGCTKKVHVKRKKQQVQRWVKNSEFTEKNSLQAEKLASCFLKNLRFTAPEIQPESAGRSSAEII